jgi:ribosome biogenesis GTPase
MDLSDIGFDEHFSGRFEEFRAAGLSAGRVAAEHRGRYTLWTAGTGNARPEREVSDSGIPESGPVETAAELSGRFRHETDLSEDLPAAGDWVAVSAAEGLEGPALIHAVLPRRSALVRRSEHGRPEGQVLAANVDVVFAVCGLDLDFNLRRIERALALIRESGAEAAVLLTKTDLAGPARTEEALDAVRAVAGGAEAAALSPATGEGVERLAPLMRPGRTACFIGSSGVGKSTLINRLLGGGVQATGPVRESDSRGRHVTTARQLFRLPSGALVMDTPGLRAFGLWGGGEGLEATFDDIRRLAASCRFADCRHGMEPGCAVKAALESGELEAGRYGGYLKLESEAARQRALTDPDARRERRAKERAFGRMIKRVLKEKGRK